jgi:uncharacterized membrane protein YdjX (TVP38/TMEM64 family)
MKLLLIILVLILIVVGPLLFFGERWDDALSGRSGFEWLQRQGKWAWAAAIGLIVADLVLPIPATGIMAALGMLYGPVIGGFVGTAGSISAGLVAYGLCRLIGERAAVRLVGRRDLQRAHGFFERSGGWAVAVSRAMPLLPEVITCLAGLTRMPFGRFVAALICGSLPMGFVFAGLGYAGQNQPMPAMAASILAPLALWPVVKRLLKTSNPSAQPNTGEHPAD